MKGDLATLAALPDEGFRFGGWYDGDGRLVSVNEVYSFVVQGDTELRPEFFAPRAYLPESLSAVLSDSVLTYEVTASEPERERLVIARYDAGGRMAGLELREAADGSLPAEPGCTWRLFLVDGAWVPLTEAVIPGSAPAEP